MVAPELFDGVSPEATADILALGTPRAVAPGEVIFDLGADAANLFIVQRGRIALTLPMNIRGQDQDVLLEERGAGQTVGWSALIPPHKFTLKATAPLPTEVLAVPRDGLTSYLAAHPSIGYRVACNVAAIVGERFQVFQAMWLREMERVVKLTNP